MTVEIFYATVSRMFKTYFAQFENVFRIGFIVWACYRLSFYIISTLIEFGSFAIGGFTYSSPNEIIYWLLITAATVFTTALGIAFILFMNRASDIIKSHKRISGLSVWIVLSILYYFVLPTVIIISTAVLKPDQLDRELDVQFVWLIPNIYLLIFQMVYFFNLSRHNAGVLS